MAHEIQPMHKPHDQLRTEPALQREHNDKYFSAFTTGESSIDVQFRNAILPKSASHYKVGVDELTVNLGNLSMLTLNTTNPETVFRIIRRGTDGDTDPDWRMHGIANDPNFYRKNFEFVVDRCYANIQDVITRLSTIANTVNAYFNTQEITGPNGFEYTDVARAAGNPVGGSHVGEDGNFLQFGVDLQGNFEIVTMNNFYAHFVIEFPLKKYRQIFFGNINQRFIWAHPDTGVFYIPGVTDDHIPYDIVPLGLQTRAIPAYAVQEYINSHNEHRFKFKGDPSLFHTLDRRVTLEVGCSLPLMNSPFVDHGKEAPDYVLGRYMFHRPYSIQSDSIDNYSIHAHGVGTLQLQGPRDRICYHQLRPQQKVQQIRLKLWLRVRTFNETSERWGMSTLVCPITQTDYWQIKLHFKEKGAAY